MKRNLLLVILPLVLLSVNLMAQIINVNPDPNGVPWIAGDAFPTSPEFDAKVPYMTLTAESAATPLPEIVDNAQLKYMPYVYLQLPYEASCVQVAELWYSFAYEINRLRNVSAGNGTDTLTNLYHPYYT